jgi:hypothetical protein
MRVGQIADALHEGRELRFALARQLTATADDVLLSIIITISVTNTLAFTGHSVSQRDGGQARAQRLREQELAHTQLAQSRSDKAG